MKTALKSKEQKKENKNVNNHRNKFGASTPFIYYLRLFAIKREILCRRKQTISILFDPFDCHDILSLLRLSLMAHLGNDFAGAVYLCTYFYLYSPSKMLNLTMEKKKSKKESCYDGINTA